MTKLITQFKNARKFGVPLLGVGTPDMAATIAELVGALNGKAVSAPIYRWDIVAGLVPLNEAGAKDAANGLGIPKDQLAAMTTNPTEMLSMLTRAGMDACIFIQNAHRFYENEAVAQAIWNLRDPFKASGRTLVLLAPNITLPVELERDVLVLDEPLPTDEQLGAIADAVYQSAGFTKKLGSEEKVQVVKAARGLAAFAAEQAIALSLVKTGIDVEELWERKRSMVEQTKGLQVYNGGETFDSIGGIARVKEFGAKLFAGNEPPAAVIFVDEIEKALAGAGGAGGGDSSGVSQDALGVLLSAMQDNEWSGMILLGPPGCAKSLYAKAMGATHQVPCIKLDLGAMKGSLVGQSEQQVRGAVKVINAVAGKGAYWVVTCNKLDNLPPELRRRFTDGVWMFDLPTAEERNMIWALMCSKYKLDHRNLPDDTNWTGADIRNVCSIAYRLKVSLKDAASYITPVAVSDPQSIDRLRRLAHGSFLSASKPGVYRMNEPTDAAPPVLAGRRVASVKGE